MNKNYHKLFNTILFCIVLLFSVACVNYTKNVSSVLLSDNEGILATVIVTNLERKYLEQFDEKLYLKIIDARDFSKLYTIEIKNNKHPVVIKLPVSEYMLAQITARNGTHVFGKKFRFNINPKTINYIGHQLIHIDDNSGEFVIRQFSDLDSIIHILKERWADLYAKYDFYQEFIKGKSNE